MKNIFLVILISTITFNDIYCQRTFEGRVESYNQGNADIATGMVEPIVIGSINSKGEFSIPLDDNYIIQLKETISKENADNDQWSTKLMTLDRAFGNCGNGAVTIENGDQPIIKLSTFSSYSIVNLEEKEILGYMMLVSSEKFAKSLNNFEHGNDQTGYFVDWYYFEKPAKVKGSCEVKTYTLTQKEEDVYEATTTYDMDIKPGWNLVKYSNDDLHIDSQGKKYVKHKSYTTLNEMPKGVKFIYSAGE